MMKAFLSRQFYQRYFSAVRRQRADWLSVVPEQARLAMLGEELAALTLLVRQQQQERAQRALHSVRAERQASNAQHNRCYLQLLQQLSSSVPPPLWLTALDSDAANGLRLRGLSRSPAAITQFERRLAGMPALPRLRLAEVAQREDGLYSFHLAARWGRDG
mgnify:CR=1 FL=1